MKFCTLTNMEEQDGTFTGKSYAGQFRFGSNSFNWITVKKRKKLTLHNTFNLSVLPQSG